MSSLERLARPPRVVPLSLRLALRLGGVGGVIGWMFFAMSMIFVAVFVGIGDFGEALALARADLVRTDGVALGWEPTNTTVNDAPVLANGATFWVDGREHECRSYAVARGLAQGERVVIEHARADPTVCRIAGMDVSVLPWWVLLIIAPFLLVGVLFILARWRSGGRTVRLLRDGAVAWGERVGREATNVRVNSRAQYKYTFRFEDALGREHLAVGRTTDTDALEDEAREAILYDPHAPERALIADTESRLLRLDRHGQWRAPGLRILPTLIAPCVALALVALTVALF